MAAALLERGARIHRRIGLVLLAHKLLPRFNIHARELMSLPPGQGRRRFPRGRLRALNHHVKGHLGVGAPELAPPPDMRGQPLPSLAGGDPFVRLLEAGYRPPRLTVRVDLFTPPSQIPLQRQLWRFYGQAGVRVHPLFRQHDDFPQPERMPELAAALEDALAEVEAPP